MTRFHNLISSILLPIVCLGVTALPASADEEAWKPIDPAHLSLKSPVVEPDADAEAIFWEIHVDAKPDRAIFVNYIRIKVFTERGKESQSKIDLPFFGKSKIEDVAARTIKPDGTIIELKKEAIAERTLVKVGGLKLRAKSFVMPAVEPGAIIEYRWKEMRRDQYFLPLHFQRDIPLQTVKYIFKTNSDDSRSLRARSFNVQDTPLSRVSDKLYSKTMTNVPAFRREPDMPPDDHVRMWMLIYYVPKFALFDIGSYLHSLYEPGMKVDDEIRRESKKIIGDATTSQEKLRRLFEFCRTRIKNIDSDASGLTDDDRLRLKPNKSPSDTLKRASGTGLDIDLLFAALANAADFDARVAFSPDRSDMFFNPSNNDQFLSLYFLRSWSIAVYVDNKWQFFDPASTYVQFGMLRWQEEVQNAMITHRNGYHIAQTPLSPPEKSLRKRSATLRLNEDGTLEGDVRMEYTGHLAAEYKEFNDDYSQAQREQTLRDMIKERLATAELSDIRIENVTDPDKPFLYSFHVRVPGYGQRTGKRLFLQPGFFQFGIGPRFPARERKHEVYFHYPWSEEDSVSIELPAGFELENPSAPGPLNISKVGSHFVDLTVRKGGRAFEYKRRFSFGEGGVILYPVGSYAQLKEVFDTIHQRDNHSITLKQSAASQ